MEISTSYVTHPTDFYVEMAVSYLGSHKIYSRQINVKKVIGQEKAQAHLHKTKREISYAKTVTDKVKLNK